VLVLMPEPEPFQLLPGRFSVTAVLVLDNSVQPDLDPRGTNSISDTRRAAKRTLLDQRPPHGQAQTLAHFDRDDGVSRRRVTLAATKRLGVCRVVCDGS
jgi:hypothetical protein